MTSASDDASSEEIHVLILRFLGAFSHVQDWMDNVIAWIFFKGQMPNAAAVVWDRAVSRINDKERVKLFLAIAKDIGTDAELDCVAAEYAELKQLRDKAAHSAKFFDYGDGNLTISKSHITALRENDWEPTKLEKTSIDRNQILRALRSCKWLEAQMTYVIFCYEPIAEVRAASGSHKLPKPARTPEQWNWNGNTEIGV